MLKHTGAGDSQPADLYQRFRTRLISGGYVPGQKLKPQSLAEEFGASPAMLREALIRLASEGYVESRPQRGFRVITPSPASVWEIAHFRILIEAEGARLSIRKGGIEWEANLTAAHHRLTHLEERMRGTEADPAMIQLWSGYDRAFHQALIAACGSSLLREQHRHAFDRFKQHVISQDSSLGFRGLELIREHADILGTALDRDAEGCIAALHRHFETFRRFSGPVPVADESPAP